MRFIANEVGRHSKSKSKVQGTTTKTSKSKKAKLMQERMLKRHAESRNLEEKLTTAAPQIGQFVENLLDDSAYMDSEYETEDFSTSDDYDTDDSKDDVNLDDDLDDGIEYMTAEFHSIMDWCTEQGNVPNTPVRLERSGTTNTETNKTKKNQTGQEH